MYNMNIFVMTPFASSFDDVYDTIRAATQTSNFASDLTCIRLDEVKSAGQITNDLIAQIKNSTFCIADLTGDNPNVMWEAGYAMALERPIIFISQDLARAPFDIRGMRILKYQRDKLAQTLRIPLADAIRATAEQCRDAVQGFSIQPQSNLAFPTELQNPLLARFLNRLNGMAYLSPRTATNATIKRALGDWFWDGLGMEILTSAAHLFFESGSASGFVAESLIHQLSKRLLRPEMPTIVTNNLIAYLDFLLFTSLEPQLWPGGGLDIEFSTFYGPIEQVFDRPPRAFPESLSEEERAIISKLSGQLRHDYGKSGCLLLSAESIDPSDELQFKGPHTGSHKIMLFKRALMESACPMVMFLDDTKIPFPARFGQSYSVCDGDFNWSTVMETVPLCLVVGCSTAEAASRVREAVVRLGLKPMIHSNVTSQRITIVVGCNELFPYGRNTQKE